MKKLMSVLLFTIFISSCSNGQDTIINVRNDSMANSSCLNSMMLKLKATRLNADSSFVVVHFGDSHIQGDFMTGVIRRNLQTVFGSAGDGILFPYSAVRSFGPKDLTTAVTGIWNSADLTKNPSGYPIGITGHTMVTTDKQATMSFVYDPSNEVMNGDGKKMERVTIWHSKGNFKLRLVKNGSADSLLEDATEYENGLRRTIVYNYKVGTELKFVFDTTGKEDGFNFHGISFEHSSLHGLQYHRCGTVGATFLQLINEQELTLTQLHRVKPDLVIFSFGSNESYNSDFKVDDYRTKVTAFIERIRKEFPAVTIIFTDTPDTRSRNRYPVNTIAINETLSQIASTHCCAFWDLNKAMGGDGSMLFWFGAGLSAKDKLHFSRPGYALQADLFSLALMNVYTKYDSATGYFCDTLHSRIDRRLDGLTGNILAKKSDGLQTGGSTSNVTYVVKSGDTLSVIARQYHVTIAELCQWNNITQNSILHIGQKILIKKK